MKTIIHRRVSPITQMLAKHREERKADAARIAALEAENLKLQQKNDALEAKVVAGINERNRLWVELGKHTGVYK